MAVEDGVVIGHHLGGGENEFIFSAPQGSLARSAMSLSRRFSVRAQIAKGQTSDILPKISGSWRSQSKAFSPRASPDVNNVTLPCPNRSKSTPHFCFDFETMSRSGIHQAPCPEAEQGACGFTVAITN